MVAGKRWGVYLDFIGRERMTPVIADAKYKLVGNISERDYQQMLDYMFYFVIHRGFYLYATN
ncbi:MAG: hypothetical protein U0K19_03090 [Bifidobacteriaceae bacterium]|nr:hypothetical protein [Bifidobacteriaceae bacterium]